MLLSLLSRMGQLMDVQLSMNDLFNVPTIEGMADLVGVSKKSIFTAIEAAEEKEYYPASPDQKRMYILNRFEGIGTTYNLSVIIRY